MDRQELISALQELDHKLNSPCEVVLVGGAAMILQFGAMRATGDIDFITHVTHVILNGVKNLSLCGGDSSQKRLRMTIPA